MNKTGLINAIALDAGLSKKDSEKFLKSFENVITDELKNGGNVNIIGFGKFDTTERKERMGKNPQTGEPLLIKASDAPRFKVGKSFKDAVNNKN